MAVKGHSTTLEYDSTPIAKIVAIKPPAPEAEAVDVSTMDSPEQWSEYTAGWAEAGEVEVTAQYAKAATAAIYAIFRVDKDFTMTFSDGSTWEFSGFLQKMSGEIERKGIIQSTFTFKISGKPEFTAAA